MQGRCLVETQETLALIAVLKIESYGKGLTLSTFGRLREVPLSLSTSLVTRKKTPTRPLSTCGHFFLAVFFRVTHDGLSERGTTRLELPPPQVFLIFFVAQSDWVFVNHTIPRATGDEEAFSMMGSLWAPAPTNRSSANHRANHFSAPFFCARSDRLPDYTVVFFQLQPTNITALQPHQKLRRRIYKANFSCRI